MADQKLTQLTELTAISGDDMVYVAEDPNGSPLPRKITVANLAPSYPADGRLTLESGVPVSTTNQTAKTTLYYTPYRGDCIALYDGTRWTVIKFSELSIAIPASTNQMYDVFCYNNSGTATLELLDWTNDTTRATAITRQNGVLCKDGALTRRYLGSVRTTASSGQCEDSTTNRFVWNYYNRIPRLLELKESTSHSYNGVPRKWNNSDTNNLMKFIIGVVEDTFIKHLRTSLYSANSANYAAVATAINGTNWPADSIDTEWLGMTYQPNISYLGNSGEGYIALGYSYLQVYETSNATAQFVTMKCEAIIRG